MVYFPKYLGSRNTLYILSTEGRGEQAIILTMIEKRITPH